jgi:hypothetical protein
MFNISSNKEKLTSSEILGLRTELWGLQKRWNFDTSLDIFDADIEDRIEEINSILEENEEEYYSDFEHTPITL